MEELDIRQIFSYLRRHFWLIICIVLVAASLSVTITYFFITPQYEASATLYVFNDANRTDTSISTTDDYDISKAYRYLFSYNAKR